MFVSFIPEIYFECCAFVYFAGHLNGSSMWFYNWIDNVQSNSIASNMGVHSFEQLKYIVPWTIQVHTKAIVVNNKIQAPIFLQCLYFDKCLFISLSEFDRIGE